MAAAITITQWARLQARAWLDPDFKALLEKDPARALTPEVRKDFGISDDAQLFDLKDPSAPFRLEDPPNERDISIKQLRDVCNDPNAYARVMGRVTCEDGLDPNAYARVMGRICCEDGLDPNAYARVMGRITCEDGLDPNAYARVMGRLCCEDGLEDG